MPDIDYRASYEAALDELVAAYAQLYRVERKLVSRGFAKWRPLPYEPRITQKTRLQPLDVPPVEEQGPL
jgi:hypothetical protein